MLRKSEVWAEPFECLCLLSGFVVKAWLFPNKELNFYFLEVLFKSFICANWDSVGFATSQFGQIQDLPRIKSSKKKKYPWKTHHSKPEYPSSQAAPEGHHENIINNVTPLIRRGTNFVFFAALYCYCLGFNACLPSRQRREAIKAINPRREQWSAAKKKKILR